MRGVFNPGSPVASARGFRIFVWSMVALQVVLLGALMVMIVLTARAMPASGSPTAMAISALVGVLEILVFPLVGLIIFTRRPEHPIGWLFCLSQIGWALNNFANGFGMYALHARPDLLPAAGWIVWFYTWPGYLSTGLFVILLLLFPDGQLPSPRWRWLVWLTAIFIGLGMFVSAFAPGSVDASGALPYPNPLGMGGPLSGLLAWANGFTQLLMTFLIVPAAISLVLRFRSARGQTRQQLKWLAGALVLMVLAVAAAMVLWTVYPVAAATPLWAVVIEQFAIFSLALVPIAAGIAIMRYRLYEIDRIINLALVYAGLTAALALIYFGCVLALQAVLSAITGEGQSTIATVLSTLAIASLFIPLRQRIQRLIDRRFYRQKYNAELVLGRLSGVLRNEVDLQLMSDQLVAVVEETLQPNQATLWIARKGEGPRLMPPVHPPSLTPSETAHPPA
jgi:hypothetical protein